MKNLYKPVGNVSVCYSKGCVHATGKYADIITAAVVILLIAVGVGMLIKINGK